MSLYLMAALNLSIIEIIVLQLGAVILGIAIHFFIISRRSLNASSLEANKLNKQFEDWKLKYFDEAEIKEKELAEIKMHTKQVEENARMHNAELEDLRRQNKKLKTELDLINEQPNLANEMELEVNRLEQQLTKTEMRNEQLSEQLAQYQQQLKARQAELESLNNNAADEEKNKEIDRLKSVINESATKNLSLTQQINNLQMQVNELLAERENKTTSPSQDGHKSDYLGQLRQAQINLQEHNEKINQLLGQIDMVKENEEKQQEILKDKEDLQAQLNHFQYLLEEKEHEINNIREKEHLAAEMSSMLDNAYAEFHLLQNKMQKMESQVNSSKMVNIEYEDLKEAHLRMSREFDQQKNKLIAQFAENQKLSLQLDELEEKYKEANFHRQQLQKRINYLEELNQDLQTMSDANKKLENQLKNIGELESKLHMIAEERDQLLRRQMGKA